LFASPFLGILLAIKFAAVNGSLRLTTDAALQPTKFYYAQGDIRKLFVAIGFDQSLHVAMLMLTAAKTLTV